MDVLSPFLWQWMLVYSTVIVVIGQSLWNKGFRISSIATVSIIGSFAPIVGILAAYLILGEVPTRAQYIGGVVILVGLFLGQVGIIANIDELYIIPEYRSRGIGTRFINWMRESRSNNLVALELQVLPYNTKALKLYEGLGFKKSDRNHLFLDLDRAT